MSSRVLRKLQGEKEREISHSDEDDEEELNFLPAKSKKKGKAVVNPFNLVSTKGSVQSTNAANLFSSFPVSCSCV